MQLTAKQLKDFNELGYVVLPNCFSQRGDGRPPRGGRGYF